MFYQLQLHFHLVHAIEADLGVTTVNYLCTELGL